MQHLMEIEAVRDLVANAPTPSEAVEAVENYLVKNRYAPEALHATVWLLVINQFRLKLGFKEKI